MICSSDLPLGKYEYCTHKKQIVDDLNKLTHTNEERKVAVDILDFGKICSIDFMGRSEIGWQIKSSASKAS